ncbi:S8 family serine peptidase [uncultured Psychroserpens sp.]|uniref:S8 family serine peptidase n=1 Tax=uncultured Psychroserpens sp. TaxID=255436 RepID=UPI002610DB0A|nr:S8 family serine peptidase [uncultured Psychroserpens sp.]
MKHILRILCVFIFAFVCSCEKENLIEDNIENVKNRTILTKGASASSELIILYPEGTTELEKQQKRLEYGITDYKQCNCAEENLELWIFTGSTGNGINIEEKKETAKVDEEIEGVDLNPIISIEPDQFAFNFNPSGVLDNALSQIVDVNQNITIAVLDTGINYYYDGFSDSYLYNSTNDPCIDNNYVERFGWNFVDNDNNPYDDHPSMHGTVVSHLITSNLDNNNVPYQLLPVKVANENGSINYFDALCGFQYATKKQNIKIINMSFGWYDQEYELLNKFIERVEDEILVVCSAGNSGQNNDIQPHYPSSYESNNIISVTGLAGSYNDIVNGTNGSGVGGLSYFSNFGTNSVDIAAVSENIPFVYDNETFYYNGTSFSAAYTSFFSAKYYQNGMSAEMLKAQVLNNSTYSAELFNIKYSAYIYDD